MGEKKHEENTSYHITRSMTAMMKKTMNSNISGTSHLEVT